MISFSSAYEQVLAGINPLGTEEVEVLAATDRVAAEDLSAVVDSPSVDVSLKDGYAVVSADLENASPENEIMLDLVGEVAAGGDWEGELRSGQAVRILSGAPIPVGANAVLAEEFTTRKGSTITASNDAGPGRNVLFKGDDVKKGAVLARRGGTLFPPIVGLLAAAGYHKIPVFRRPRVGILASGDEVIAPGQQLLAGKLYASNLVTLAAWCQKYGFEVKTQVVKDDADLIRESMGELLDECDALLTSGGAWSGERDLVVRILEEMNWRKIFHRVRMGPGKAAGFGELGSKPVFCLPGGPPSNHMAFLQLALPGLHRLAGFANPGLKLARVKMAERITGQKDWTQFVLGTIIEESSQAVFYPIHRLSRLQMLSNSEAIVKIPEGKTEIRKDDLVLAQKIVW